MYFVIKKRLFINAVCPRFEFQFSIHIHVFLIEKKMNGTIRKFMMENLTEFLEILGLLINVSRNSYFTRRVKCKLTENMCYDKITGFFLLFHSLSH